MENSNPMNHPEEQPVIGEEGAPRFGRLLLVLLVVVVIIAIVTFASEAYYS
jgi:hypothetical protein